MELLLNISIETNTFSGFHPCISSERSADQCDQTLCWSTAAWLHRQMLVISCSLDLEYFVLIFLWLMIHFDMWSHVPEIHKNDCLRVSKFNSLCWVEFSQYFQAGRPNSRWCFWHLRSSLQRKSSHNWWRWIHFYQRSSAEMFQKSIFESPTTKFKSIEFNEYFSDQAERASPLVIPLSPLSPGVSSSSTSLASLEHSGTFTLVTLSPGFSYSSTLLTSSAYSGFNLIILSWPSSSSGFPFLLPRWKA